MTVTEHKDPLGALPYGDLPHDGSPYVDGVLPAGLDGTFVQAGPHPAASARPYLVTGRALISGVRLGGGTARWHKATEGSGGERLGQPPGPAIWNRAEGPADPPLDGPSRASVAPPLRDREGDWHTIATYPGLDVAEHLVIGPGGGVRAARPFVLDGAPLMRAVALTERFVVVFDLPVTYRRAAALVGTGSPYRWRSGRPARIGLLPRRAAGPAEPVWFPVSPCFVSQAVNAYESGHRVVVDAVRHDRAFDTPSGDLGGVSQAHRWTLDLSTGTAGERPLTGPVESAGVDTRLAGREHQLIFGCAGGGRAIVGHDLAAEVTQVRELGPGRRAGRPVFVPRGVAEGDGWLLVMTQDAARHRSELLVLDALNLAGRPEAVVRLPVVLPAAHHTTWVPAHHR
ncbi:carotenoid oxygenase family protein [Sphaerisporangium corydalis]|uniref:Dioxygenase n=1 Tax=Sphaerisporangium corydalis TaxID=1441875 RepID=A0ABV9EMZ3_9ACTN|nr:carotenoid oxygenase family protein [Sphaerisporangium corydalis]